MNADLATQFASLVQVRGLLGEDVFEANLQKLRAQYGDPAVDALLQSETPPSAAPGTTQIVTGRADVAVAGDVKGNIYLYGRRGKTSAELLRAYLQRLTKRCGALPLQGVREQRGASDVLNVSLEQVYTQLATTALMARERLNERDTKALDVKQYRLQHIGSLLLPHQQRPTAWFVRKNEPLPQPFTGRTLIEQGPDSQSLETLSNKEFAKVVGTSHGMISFGPQLVTEAIANQHHLVLLGEPGSGKSTALRYLALTLAEAGLDEQVDLAQRLEGWDTLGEQGRLLPIFLPLLPLAKRLANEPGKAGSDEDMWNAIADHLEPKGANAGLAAAVRDELEAGRVLLMLDGLDEVAGDDSRRRVISAVHDFAAQHANCRIIVACRVRAYEGTQNAEWQLPGWPTATLADWTVGQMHYFIDAWYGEAAKASAMPDAKRDERIAKLKGAISNRDDLKKLGVRPLLLTIMALVHLNDGRLPEDRVSLYSRCIDILLGQWEVAGKDETVYGSLMDYVGLPDTNVKTLRPLLTKAAFAAHEASGPDDLGRIGRATLREMVQDELEALKHPNPHQGAKLFLEYTDVRAGLLQASDAGDAYAFPHQTFQEYLAGLELVSGVGFVDRIMDRRTDDRWRVPIFLGISHAVSEGLLAAPYQLLNRLLKAKGRTESQRHADMLLAAELAADVTWDRLERGGEEFVSLRSELAQGLAKLVEGTALPAANRVRAGVLLGELGDPRPGVCDFNLQMKPFPDATFLIGEANMDAKYDNEKNDKPITLAPFALARYPVTNAQYALFMAHDGYNLERRWWDDAGKRWLRRERRREPSSWSHEHFGHKQLNHPVVGVTWYEASAFCRWLTQHLHDGWEYRLPSEAEWEYAARGTARRTYPWGPEEPDAERANHNGIYDGTIAVGSFPAGATPDHLDDMAGNMWEWTASVYADYAKGQATVWQPPDDMVNKHFTLRGGGWDGLPLDLRGSNRDKSLPESRFYVVGFRLARYLPAD